MNDQFTADPYPPYQPFQLYPIQVNQWQLCPLCNGKGQIQGEVDVYGSLSSWEICHLCNGKKIISSLTGQPPQ